MIEGVLFLIFLGLTILLFILSIIYYKIRDRIFDKKFKNFESIYSHKIKEFKEASEKFKLMKVNIEQTKLHIDEMLEKIRYMPKQLKAEQEDKLEMLKADYIHYLKEFEDFKVDYELIRHNYYKLREEYFEEN